MRDKDKSKDRLTKELVELRKRAADLQASERQLKQAVTEPRATEEWLREEGAFLDTALEFHRDTLFVFDPVSGIPLRWNRSFVRVSGYSDEEIRSMMPVDFYQGEDLQRLARAIQAALKEGYAPLEASLVTKDGRRIPYEYSGVLLKDHQGNPLAICAIGRDITERKQAEEAIRFACAELAQVFNTAADGMGIIDKDFNILRINEAFSTLSGASQDEAVGRKCHEIFGDRACQTSDCPLTRILSGEERVEYETERQRNDGIRVPCIVAATPFRAPGGELIGIVKNFKDITERKRAEEALRERTHDLGERVKELDCLHRASKLMAEPGGRPLDEIIQGIADLIPASWEYSDITCARITFKGREYKTGNFNETAWKQSANISVFGEKAGFVEVCYLQAKPAADEGPFLKEERNLINALAAGIGEFAERKQMEEGLRDSEERLAIRNKIASIFLTVSDEEMYGEVLQTVLEAMESAHGAFGYIDEKQALVCPGMTREIRERYQIPDKEIVFPRETWGGIWGRALIEKKTLYSNEAFQVREGHIPAVRALDVPIIHQGKVIGNLLVSGKATDYDEKDKEVLEAIADCIAPILHSRLERGRVETERKQAEEALEQSEANYRTLVEASPDGVISISAKGRVIDCNEAACNMLGYAKDEIKGKRFRELVPNLQDVDLLPYFTQLNENKQGEHEFELVHRHGPAIPVWAKAVAIYDSNGHFNRSVLYVRDIAERKKLDQLKDELIGLASHELRSPLTVIMGAISTALTEETRLSPKEKRQLLQDAALEAELLSHLLGNLLELSRAQADRLVLYTQPVSLKKVVENAVEKVGRQFAAHRFLIDLPRQLPPVSADELRSERILHNLLENAAKYSPKGSEIRVFARREGEHLVIGITDQGPGILRRDQANIFAPFHRLGVHRLDGARGAGLGLVVCRRLVEAHGGRIWVESEPGHGSTFFFTLPLLREAI